MAKRKRLGLDKDGVDAGLCESALEKATRRLEGATQIAPKSRAEFVDMLAFMHHAGEHCSDFGLQTFFGWNVTEEALTEFREAVDEAFAELARHARFDKRACVAHWEKLRGPVARADAEFQAFLFSVTSGAAE